MDYHLGELMIENSDERIFQGHQGQDKALVFIRTARNQQRLRLDFERAKQLASSGVRLLDYYDLTVIGQDLSLVIANNGCLSLVSLMANKAYNNISVFLAHAINLVESLKGIHQQNMVHGGLRSACVWVKNEDQSVYLTSFEFCQNINVSNHKKHRFIWQLEDARSVYFSPEQLKAKDQTVDIRSDFFALGCIFYQMLTGYTPFSSSNPLTQRHSIIARMPIPLLQVRPELPSVIDSIVMKLLAKNKKERYQSCEGLLVDLAECQRQISAKNTIEYFSLARADFGESFADPKSTYGRDLELNQIMAHIEQASHGGKQCTLVIGEKGAGKTKLLRAVENQLQQNFPRYNYSSGSFSHAISTTPYSAIVTALQTLLNRVLMADDDVLSRWKKQINEQLQPHANIACELLPALEMIIGPQPDANILGPEETKYRIHWVIGQIIALFARKDRPLVLMLDNLHNAPGVMIDLLQNILKKSDIDHLLIIATRCEQSQAPYPGVHNRLKFEMQADKHVRTLYLSPLSVDDISLWLAHSMGRAISEMKHLAQLIHKKTTGNPQQVRSFLHSAYADRSIHYDPEQGWKFELERIGQLGTTDSAIDMLLKHYDELSNDQKLILKTAACLGQRFDLSELEYVAPYEKSELMSLLDKPLKLGLLLQDNKEIQFPQMNIQKYIYESISQHDKEKTYLSIAIALNKQITQAGQNNHLFKVVDYYNKSSHLLTDKADIKRLLELNMQAATNARKIAGYGLSARYLQTGYALLTSHLDGYDAKHSFDLLKQWAEVEHLNGNMESAKTCIENLYQHAKTLSEYQQVYHLHALQLIYQGDFHGALKVGIKALESLDVLLPNPEQLSGRVYQDLESIIETLSVEQIAELVNLPVLKDSKVLMAHQMLAALVIPAFDLNPLLFFAIVIQAVRLNLKLGHGPTASVCYSSFSVVLINYPKYFDKAQAFAKLALTLVTKSNQKLYSNQVYIATANYVTHWIEPAEVIIKINDQALVSSMEQGDHLYASFSLAHRTIWSFSFGHSLKAVMQLIDKALEFRASLKLDWPIASMDALQLIIEVLQGQHALDLEDGLIHSPKEDGLLNPSNQTLVHLMPCFYRILKGELFLMLGRSDLALTQLQLAKPSMSMMIANYQLVNFYFLYSLSCLESYKKNRNPKLLTDIAEPIKKLKIWSKKNPANVLGKYYLVKAKWAVSKNRKWQAWDYFEKAIEYFDAHNQTQFKALSCEYAAQFFIDNNKRDQACRYLQIAHREYKHWGAVILVRRLEDQFAALLFEPLPNYAMELLQPSNESLADVNFSELDQMDFAALEKVLIAIRNEIEYERLLSKLMSIILELAGAKKAVLILNNEHKLKVEALLLSDSNHLEILQSTPIENTNILSQAIVKYVLHTKTPLLLANAKHEGLFIDDSYIIDNNISSVLCMPIPHRGTVYGILYLEHDQNIDAFSHQRISAFKIMLSQVAISLEICRVQNYMSEAISQRVEAEALQMEMESIVESIPDFVALVNKDLKVYYINPQGKELIGLSLTESINHLHVLDLYPKEYQKFLRDELFSEKVLREKNYRDLHRDLTLINRIGMEVPIQQTTLFHRAVTGQCYYSIVAKDMTQRIESIRLLKQAAHYDPLTQLANRNLFLKRIDKAIHSERDDDHIHAIMVIDIDQFKVVNDQWGHEIGNQLLIKIADFLDSCRHSHDTLARLGGDEFALLISNTRDTDRATRIARRLINHAKYPFIVAERQIFITFSIGVAIFPEHGNQATELLQCAYTAKYAAKKLGRCNYQFFNQQLHYNQIHRARLESYLRQALSQESFTIVYQPKVTLSTGKICGMEALVRWYHDELGMVQPQEFIPLAEETGLIIPVGRVVLHKACTQGKQWLDRNILPGRIAVNLSARQIQRNILMETIDNVLAQTGFPAHYLELEVTESAVIADTKEAIELMYEIKKRGIHLTLDDFGTGYSGLMAMRDYPLDTIKVDRAFVVEDDINEHILKALIPMAKALNLEVVAEGIETIEQLQRLSQFGDLIGQGELFSHPVQAKDFEKLINKQFMKY